MSSPPKWNEKRFLESLSDPWYRLLATSQDNVSGFTHDFFRREGLITLNLPLTTGAVSSPMAEGSDSLPLAARLGNIDTYLADSMQFYLEYGCRLSAPGCYYLMPSFRGEQADETHLCQFYHAEAEIPGKLGDILTLIEKYIRGLSANFLANTSASTSEDISIVATSTRPFPRVNFVDALKILSKEPGAIKQTDGGGNITRLGERRLISEFSGPVWLMYFPAHLVPFYQARCLDNPDLAACADLLLGQGELVGAGERHVTSDNVLQALASQKVQPDPYEWYIAMKRVMPLQTSGFGMGVERFLSWALNEPDIRKCELIPRRNGELLNP